MSGQKEDRQELAATVLGAIQLHGGRAADARGAFERLSPEDREALLTFLRGL